MVTVGDAGLLAIQTGMLDTLECGHMRLYGDVRAAATAAVAKAGGGEVCSGESVARVAEYCQFWGDFELTLRPFLRPLFSAPIVLLLVMITTDAALVLRTSTRVEVLEHSCVS